jgi:tetratricopeptide (TPR) repeat protein
MLVVLALAASLATKPASADPVTDCNEATNARLRLDGCTEIIASDPAPDVLATALMNRAIAHAAMRDLNSALADLDAALDADQSLLEARYNRGNVYVSLGRPEPAIDDFTAVIDAAPAFALAWLNRGLAYEQKGDLDTARSDLQKALGLDPGLASAKRALARIMRKRPTASVPATGRPVPPTR